MVFVVDDLGAWLVALLADAGRKRLTTVILGSDQERALRRAAKAAAESTAGELCPGDDERAGQLMMVIGEVFRTPAPDIAVTGQVTVLEALQAGVAGQLAPLADADLTGVGISSAAALGVPPAVLARTLTGHLVREIVVRGARGGPLAPLAVQMNFDVTHLRAQRIEDILGQLDSEVRHALARLDKPVAIAAVPTALDQLPPAVAGFTGRDRELAVLSELLNPAGSSGAAVSVVAGLAGIGKTTLAVAAGHAARGQNWFGGGILFMDVHGYDETPVEPGQALDALLRALGVAAERIPPAMAEQAALYRSALAQISEPVLVIVDNASSGAQVTPLLPGAGPHKVLVTSRNILAGLRAQLVEVAVLDDAAAVALLDEALRIARSEDDRITGDLDAAGRLAGICGGLPLALQITAALLTADPTLSPAELADELGDEQERLRALRFDDGGGAAATSVEAAFDLSYGKLEEVPARIFRLLPVNPGPDVSTAAVAAMSGLPASQVRRVLAGLAQAHLAEAVADAPGRWRMHDLLRLYAEQISDVYAEADDREQALNELLVYYLETANEHCKDLPRKAQRSDPALQDNALAWLDAERPSLIPAVALAAETGRDEIARTLPLVLAPYLDWRRRFEDGLATLTIGLGIARRRDERSVEASTLTVLSLAQRQLRRFDDAVATATEAVAICREIGDRREEGIALLHLGMALADSRRFKKAIAAYRDAGAAFRETGDWPNEAMVLGNLGLDLTQLRRFEEAILAHQQAAVIYRASGDRHGESTALGNLSLALRETGQDEEAIAACQEALSISREISDRHGEATELCNLGNALLMSGRFAEAITAHQEAAEIFRETGDRNREGEELTNLGSALLDAGRADEALTAHQDALAVFRETGDQHGEAGALNNLGLALSEVGRFEDAIAAYRESAAAFRRTGDRHRERIALANLEATISAAGK